MFIEAVLSFLGVKTKEDTMDSFCEACKQAGKDLDCASCDRNVEIEDKRKDTIG